MLYVAAAVAFGCTGFEVFLTAAPATAEVFLRGGGRVATSGTAEIRVPSGVRMANGPQTSPADAR
ncbi:hypothetical protein CCMA1212_008163 [Trichoderma ghanense]|uniref:Uncharacterized protein n=1 Tax=Trichoderma ghanense TaxID=65468 RepID=A0ABY2GY83_9HYPO